MDGDGGEGGKKPLFSLSISPPRPPSSPQHVPEEEGRALLGRRRGWKEGEHRTPPSLSLLPPSKRGKESHHHYRHCDRGEEKGGRREKGGLLFPFPSARRHTHKESDERRRRRILAAAVASPPSFPPLPPLLIFPPPPFLRSRPGGRSVVPSARPHTALLVAHCTLRGFLVFSLPTRLYP